MTLYRRFGKRLFDLSLAVPASILLLPVWLVVALLVFAIVMVFATASGVAPFIYTLF